MCFDTQTTLLKIFGVNLLEIPDMNSKTASTLVSEIGSKATKRKNSKHYKEEPQKMVICQKRADGANLTLEKHKKKVVCKKRPVLTP